MLWTSCIAHLAPFCFSCRTQEAGLGVPPSGMRLVLLPMVAGCRAWCCDAGTSQHILLLQFVAKGCGKQKHRLLHKRIRQLREKRSSDGYYMYWSAHLAQLHPVGSRLVGVRMMQWEKNTSNSSCFQVSDTVCC